MKQYPKIDIFINGRYECSTTRSKTCKEALASYKERYETDVFMPDCKITASFN